MATSVVNIKSVSWSANPVNTSQPTLISIQATVSVTDTIKANTSVYCNTSLLVGSLQTVESPLTP